VENTVPFDIGKFRKFKPEFLVEWNAPRVNVPTLRKLKGNLQHSFIVLGEMADANNDAISWISHKGKKIQKYSLAFKKEVIAYAEARGNRPPSRRFQLMKREYENGELRKVILKVCLDLPKESNGAD